MGFLITFVVACILALWLGASLPVIALGLVLPAVVVMLYVVRRADANLLVKLLGLIVGLGGTAYWVVMVAQSDNPDRPGDLPVAALFFGIPGTIISLLLGIFLVIVFSRHDEPTEK